MLCLLLALVKENMKMLLKNKLCILSNFNFCDYAKLPCCLKEGNLGWS